jgi:hypothetical protein
MCLVQGQWMVVVVVVEIVVCCCPLRVVIPVTEYGRCPVMRCCPVMAARPCIAVQWPLVIVPRPSSVEVQCSIVVVTHQPEVVDWSWHVVVWREATEVKLTGRHHNQPSHQVMESQRPVVCVSFEPERRSVLPSVDVVTVCGCGQR